MSNSYEYVKKSIDRRVKKLREIKSMTPCEDCKNYFPHYVMDYHHKERESKSFSLGQGVYRNSWQKILSEIEKCDLLCANCHREREYGT